MQQGIEYIACMLAAQQKTEQKLQVTSLQSKTHTVDFITFIYDYYFFKCCPNIYIFVLFNKFCIYGFNVVKGLQE